jgi:choline dehydrogenase-like flavoprotein
VFVNGPALPTGAKLTAEVAVVGAGPAGIVTALELADAGHDVVLLESGGTSFDRATQALADTSDDDPLHASMSRATRRQLGGASILWGGRCVPFDRVDFEPREIVEHGRWPVGYDELSGYFQRACDWFVCGRAAFDAREIPGLSGAGLIPGFPEGDVRTTTLERWSLPTRFGGQYGKRLRDHPSLRLVTGLTCTEVVRAEAETSVQHLEARALDGRAVTVSAGRYVLACGGLETTRLLMASRRHEPAGLGNHSGHLGRWYMAHVESRIARVRFTASPRSITYGHERDPDGVYVRRRISFTSAFAAEHRLPNLVLWLANPELKDPAHGSGILSLVYLMLISPAGRYFIADAIREAHTKGGERRPDVVRAHLRNVLEDLGPAAWFALRFGYQRYLRRGRKVPAFYVRSDEGVYPLVYHAEHLPHPDGRVELSDEKDALGMPRLRTHLRFDDRELTAVVRAHRHLDDYLRQHGLGELEFLDEHPERSIRGQLFGGYHQAGTTRMSADAADGVVDRNLAVHGFDDLFVASSSTFVTSGQANSTFMVVAFALRLVDHLRADLLRADTGQPVA